MTVRRAIFCDFSKMSSKIKNYRKILITTLFGITFAYLSPLNNLINLLPMLAKTVIACFWIAFGVGCVDGSTATRSRKTLPQWTCAQPTHGLHSRRQNFCWNPTICSRPEIVQSINLNMSKVKVVELSNNFTITFKFWVMNLAIECKEVLK